MAAGSSKASPTHDHGATRPPEPQPAARAHRRPLPANQALLRLQRKCSCGGAGECDACAARTRLGVQPKVAVGPRDDPFEREADAVADRVMRHSGPEPRGAPGVTPLVQREDDEDDDEPDAGELRRKAAGPAPPAANLSAGTLTHGGSPLPDPVRGEFERRFGRDFSAVRIHAGQDAERAARDLKALAFTFGSHIWLGRGQRLGLTALLAHELTHVVQQTLPPPLPQPAPATKPTPAGPTHETPEEKEFRGQPYWIQRRPGDPIVQRCPPQPSASDSLTISSRLTVETKAAQGLLRVFWCDAVGNEVIWVQYSWEPADDRPGPAWRLDVVPGNPSAVTITAEATHRVDVVIDTVTEQALTSVNDEIVQVRHIYRFPGGVTRHFGGSEFERTEAPVELAYEYYPHEGELRGQPPPKKLPPIIRIPPPPKPKWEPKVWIRDTQEKFDEFAASHADTKWADVLLPDGKHVAYALTVESATRMADKLRISDVNFEFLSYYPGGKVVAVWLYGEKLPTVEALADLYYRNDEAALAGSRADPLEAEVFQMEGKKFGRKNLTHQEALTRWNELASLPPEDLATVETSPGQPFHALKIRGASGVQIIRAPELDTRIPELERQQEFGAADPLGDDLTKPLPAGLSMGDVVSQLKTLYRRKQNAVENREPIDEIDALDGRIDELIGRLRELGVRRDETDLFKAIQAGTALDKVTGRLVVNPVAPWFMGQNFTVNVVLDYLPPGSSVEIGWRWSAKGKEYQFFSHGDRSPHLSLTPDGLFWNAAHVNDIGKAGGVEITADLYLDKKHAAETRFSTGWMPLTDTLPATVSIDTPRVFVVGGWMHAKIAEFVPIFSKFSVDWFMDGTQVVTDVPSCDRKVDTAGSFKLSAKVYRVSRSFGIRSRELLFEPSVDIIVEDMEAAGASVLAELAKQKLPSLAQTGVSMEASIADLKAREAEGGSQADYWKMRRQAQEKRFESLGRLAPDWRTTETLPGDPAAAAADKSYALPIPAALVLPGEKQPLLIYLTAHKEGDLWKARLLDVTGADVWKFDGEAGTPLEAIHNAFVDWKGDHPYPYGGKLVYSYNPPGWTFASSFDTTRVGNVAKAFIDGLLIAGMLVAGALLLAAPEATITKVVGLALIAATIARSTYQIAENIDLGIAPLDSRNILEGIAIVTSVVGVSGTALRQVGIRAARPFVYRVGSWTVLATVTADAATLVYATDQALDMLRSVEADPTKDDSQKALEIARIMTTLMAQGLMFIIANKDMVSGKTGLRRSDFFATDPKATLAGAQGAKGRITLEPGARLDIAAELRKAGDLVAPLATMDGGELLTRYSMLPWLKEGVSKETTADLLKRLSTDSMQGLSDLHASRVKTLADTLADDAVLNALAPLLRGTNLSSLVDGVGRAKVLDLHAVFKPEGVATLVADLEVARLTLLVGGKGGVSAADLRAMSASLGNGVLKNLAMDAATGLTGQQIKHLAATHGDAAVKWAGTELTGKEAQTLLTPLTKDAVKGLQDVGAKTAQGILAAYGKDIVNAVAPTVGGERLHVMRSALGDEAAKRVATHNLADLATLNRIGDNLKTLDPTLAAAKPVTAGSLIVDSNTLIALADLMSGKKVWAGGPPTGLATVERNAINALRARNGLPPLTAQPADLDLASLIGTSDLRGGNVVLGEVGPKPGLAVGAVELTASRNSAEYVGVLDALEKPAPPVGKPGGAADRAAVADAAFAKSTGGPPQFQTADQRIFERLAAKFRPDLLVLPPALAKTSPPRWRIIQENMKPAPGFLVQIPDGLGGSHDLFVIPVFP